MSSEIPPHCVAAARQEVVAPRQATGEPAITHRADYRPYPYAIDLIELHFELALLTTRVTARMDFRRVVDRLEPLVLNGEGLQLVELRLDGEPIAAQSYQRTRRELIISQLPARGKLQITAEVGVGGAGSEGLICIDDVFVTHCEPEGFRQIMFFPDRPDVLTRYRCTLTADAERYPTLLSNGHLVEQGSLPGNRHYARWEDPFPKASYLFALVAGRMASTQRQFVTASGRAVDLNVHCAPDDLRYCEVGLATLLAAIRWDEAAYGREYDLDVLNVAVLRSYPGGGMENKGLNLYSAEFFLTAPEIATDDERRRVQAVIAHEYFHNWTGNRVGCRSWFELSLKEGFTIFRQQQFMATLLGEPDARIDDILRLEELQYPEDEGGMAHAVRPDAYIAASNLYTKTVYEKGAEIIRMLHMIVGAMAFRAAADAFFERFDGVATTLDDLLDTVEQVCGRGLSLFRRWYSTAGPVGLSLRTAYDAHSQRYTISCVQTARERDAVLEIPLRFSLLGYDGKLMRLHGSRQRADDRERTITLTQAETTVVLEDVPERPTLLLQGFSAPVRLDADLQIGDLVLLATSDCDPIARWRAAQRIAELALANREDTQAMQGWFDVVRTTLTDSSLDPAIAGRLLQLPSERRLGERSSCIDVERLHSARIGLANATHAAFDMELRETYLRLRTDAQASAADGARRLRNLCLWYLMRAPNAEDVAQCWDQFRAERLLENTWSAARCLIDLGGAERRSLLEQAHARWRGYPALLDHWFAAQAAADTDDCADRVARLVDHPDLSLDNSARLKATFDAFADNQHAFHAASGVGYDTVLHIVRALNSSNPRLAARFLRRFDGWTRFDEQRRTAIQQRLHGLLRTPDLAPPLREIATKSLEAARADAREILEERQ